MNKFISILFLSFFAFSFIFAQDAMNFNEDFVKGQKFHPDVVNWYPISEDAGNWCPTGTFPDLPAVTYFQEARWLGDTLYVHTPSTTGGPTNTIRKYTVGGSWSTTTNLPASLAGGAMTVCNGRLYFLGGGTTSITTGPVNTVYEYNPATGAWTTKAPMPVALTGHSVVSWGDSVIFVVGGPYSGSATNLNVHYYRVATNTWGTITNSLPSGQGRRTFGLGISGNKIIMCAGFNTAFLKSTYIGTIGASASQITWTAGPTVPTIYTGLSRPGGNAIDKYFFLVCGERGGPGGYYDTTHVFDAQLEQWVDIVNNKPVKMSNIFNAVAPRLHGDTIKVYVPGGYGSVTGATPGIAWASFDAIACGNLLVIPVELVSFTASANSGEVTLNWQTSTEKNNSGFEIQRRSDAGYASIGFVPGFGTTTEKQYYSYVDTRVNPGSYYYRLKQIDFDGTIAYSEEVSVEVSAPELFALDQNYPNPFNPATTIGFSLAADSKVILKVYNALGQEVSILVNENLSEGFHEISFNASNLNSGVYFYKIEATGVNGQSFTQVRKMMLTK